MSDVFHLLDGPVEVVLADFALFLLALEFFFHVAADVPYGDAGLLSLLMDDLD